MVSQAGPVTISITAFSTEWPDLDHLLVGRCSERTWRLPPSETYALVVTNHVTYDGPEDTCEIVLTHPR
jgi:hypothetical protein